MTRDLGRRIRKLESSLPPLITDGVSRIFALLWFAIAYYFGKPLPDEKPFAAYVRALGYGDRDELNHAMLRNYREVANRISSAEYRVCEEFGIHIPSLEESDSESFSKALERMEAGLPQSYKNQLKTLSTGGNDLVLKRIGGDLFSYLRYFA
jgi:hypothetical protein